MFAMFSYFLLSVDDRMFSIGHSRPPVVRMLFRCMVNIALASLASFAIVGSAACAARIVIGL